MRPATANPSNFARMARPAPGGTSRIVGALMRHATERPHATAIAIVDGRGDIAGGLTHVQLEQIARAIAGMINAKPGDLVMLVASNSAEFVAWFCAALMAGVRLLPVHPGSTAAELSAVAARSRAVAIIAAPELNAARALDIRRIDLMPIAGPGREDVPREFHVPPGDIVLPSSGTTGLPKLVMRESAALDAVAANVAQATHLTSVDRMLAAIPLCHSYGVDMLLAALLAGAAVHIAEHFDPLAIAAHLPQITVFPGVPVMFESLARLTPEQSPTGLRLAFSAGSALPARVSNAFTAAWGCPVGQLYGATELGSVTFNHPGTQPYDHMSVGLALRDVSMRIVDPAEPSRVLPANEPGHIAIAAPSMLSGCLDGEAEFIDGHLLTGDLGFMDANGLLFVTGRLRLLIDVGGVKVNPLEVEQALAAHPGVAECVVLPLRLSDTVTRLRAVFIARDAESPPDEAALRLFLKSMVSAHKVPRVIERAASLPRSPTGKILRQRMMES